MISETRNSLRPNVPPGCSALKSCAEKPRRSSKATAIASPKAIIMFLAEQLTEFYPDLNDERFTSNFAIFHQRYSTNTFPTWWLAQPFRVLAHNGEINTLKGNVNWMKAHECRMHTPTFGENIDDLMPVITSGSSDSAALDAVTELMVRAGRDLPMVKSMLIPEAWSQNPDVPPAHKDLYGYCNAVMEPWDGPAAICAYGGRWAVAGMDRNGLRPMWLLCHRLSGMARARDGTMPGLLCFGLGFTARVLAERKRRMGWRVVGTSREPGAGGLIELLQFDRRNPLSPDRLKGVSHAAGRQDQPVKLAVCRFPSPNIGGGIAFSGCGLRLIED